MTDRYTVHLKTALASNTGGPYTATWDRYVVAEAGTIRSAYAFASSVASNARQSTVDIYLQASAIATGVSAASNTGTTVLVSPITLPFSGVSVGGSVRESGKRVAPGDVLELRTSAGNIGSQPCFTGLTASVVIERD